VLRLRLMVKRGPWRGGLCADLPWQNRSDWCA